MKKTVLAFLIFATTTLTAVAQSSAPAKVSLGLDIGAPVGQASQVYSFVLGGSIKIESPVNRSAFNLVFTTGYTSFMVNSNYSQYGVQNGMYIPVEAGGKFYFNSKTYFEFDLGPSFNLNRFYTGDKVEFMYSPVLGISLPTADGGATDIGFRYEARSQQYATLGQVALRLAYRFK